jgi:hypothetical protein
MAVILHMPSAFDRFSREGQIIGRMVIEYGAMEWDFCMLVSAVTGDESAAVKVMYRARGEQQRIDLGDALARDRVPVDVRQRFEQCVADVHVCRKIRNRYAHAQWVDTVGMGLAFVDLEALAEGNEPIDLHKAPYYGLDLALIEDEQRFFVGSFQNLRYLNMQARAIREARDLPDVHYVDPLLRPRKPALIDLLAISLES